MQLITCNLATVSHIHRLHRVNPLNWLDAFYCYDTAYELMMLAFCTSVFGQLLERRMDEVTYS
jgi:hypothetical protein